MPSAQIDILLVGCGHMGGALLRGWLDAGLIRRAFVVDPSGQPQIPDTTETQAIAVKDASEITDDFHPDWIVFAIKPQGAEDILPAYKRYCENGANVLGILAGKPLSFYQDILGRHTPIIRAIPNLAATIGKGITGVIKTPSVDKNTQNQAAHMFAAVGNVIWLDNEDDMHALTAVSGSGPAYVFAFVEALEAAGIAQGLPPEMAQSLARHTVIGASELLKDNKQPTSVLRQAVTSKGGTTAAGLDVLQDHKALAKLLTETVAAAAQRSKEL